MWQFQQTRWCVANTRGRSSGLTSCHSTVLPSGVTSAGLWSCQWISGISIPAKRAGRALVPLDQHVADEASLRRSLDLREAFLAAPFLLRPARTGGQPQVRLADRVRRRRVPLVDLDGRGAARLRTGDDARAPESSIGPQRHPAHRDQGQEEKTDETEQHGAHTAPPRLTVAPAGGAPMIRLHQFGRRPPGAPERPLRPAALRGATPGPASARERTPGGPETGRGRARPRRPRCAAARSPGRGGCG